ncbi:MAG TPA: hypothetical protein VFM77_07355, partial [Terriglobales bacterium]|nr:hypothetical protein [Terriglobales bacterium]
MIKLFSFRTLTSILLALGALTVTAFAQETTMTLAVDESQAPRRIAFVHEEIRVQPGSLSLS